MTQNEFTLLYAIRKYGMQSCRWFKEKTGLSVGYVSQTLKEFAGKNFVNPDGITANGIEALAPYKVENAVIMAAGMSSRFVPISLEKPKGLLTVKGEVLIERQIRQLQEAGIESIVLVLGYKKEAFFYLEDKFEHVKIIINPQYDTKNNTFTVYLAQQYIGNTYICSSDNYFSENPFEEYVYQSFYSAVKVDRRLNEWYMIPDSKMNIARIVKNDDRGCIMMGHVYWDRDFSKAMIELINADQEIGHYDTELWEQILADHLKTLPPMAIKVYPDGVIHEFDSLEELRQFDSRYISHTDSRIIRNIADVLHCGEEEICEFRVIKNGLTNRSVYFEACGKKYVYRYTEQREGIAVNRSHERQALELAYSIGADPTFLYMNEEEGWKISSYAENAHEPDFTNRDDIKRVADALRKLHDRKLSVNWSFLPWVETQSMEWVLRSEKGGISDPEYSTLKNMVGKAAEACTEDGTAPCFCHCDSEKTNWLLTDKETILIDWEYAGNADPGCDTGSFILNSGWEPEEAKTFIREYLGDNATEEQVFHHLAYTAVIAFYWYTWALSCEAEGTVMGEGLYNWRSTAKKYARYLVEQYGL